MAFIYKANIALKNIKNYVYKQKLEMKFVCETIFAKIVPIFEIHKYREEGKMKIAEIIMSFTM